MNDELTEVKQYLRDFLNCHYWRDGKGCSCGFWAGDYDTWMATHAVPLLYSPVKRWLNAADADTLRLVAEHEQHHIYSVHTGAIVQSVCACGEQFPTQGSCEAWKKHILSLKRTRVISFSDVDTTPLLSEGKG